MRMKTSVGAAAFSLLIGLAACGKPEPDLPVAPAPEPAGPVVEETVSETVPAPAAGGVVRDVTSENAGQTIALKVGEKFSISLSGVPTAGYVWVPDTLPAFLVKTDELGGPTTTAQSQPGFTGGNHWEVTVFEAKSAGSAELVMVQRRPWEDKSEPDNQTFKINVKVD